MREERGEDEMSAWWNPKRDMESSWELLKSSWLNVLLLAAPLGIAAHALQWSATNVFLLVRRALPLPLGSSHSSGAAQ